ncbi:hypothetical protein ACFLU6_13765 [Acidobacteriota bacterium]
MNIGPAVIEVILGLLLILKRQRARGWAMVWVVLELAPYGALQLDSGDFLGLLAQILFTVGILMMLIGTSTLPRLVGGICLVCVYMFASAVATFNPSNIVRAMKARSFQIKKMQITKVRGMYGGYAYEVPTSDWYLRKDKAAKSENWDADTWLVNLKNDAHVVVIHEYLPSPNGQNEVNVDLSEVAKVVILSHKRKASSFQVLENGPLLGGRRVGHLIHTSGVINNQNIEHYSGLFAAGEHIYQVVCFAEQKTFPTVKDDFMSILHSFRATRSGLD